MRSRSLVAALAALALLTLPVASTASSTPTGVVDAAIPSAGTATVIARFEHAVPDAVERIPGVRVTYRFSALPAVVASATPDAQLALARLPGLAHLALDSAVAFDLNTATVASRARDVRAPASGEPVKDADGDVVDGSGVGIAVVDTGLDATHPDFDLPGKVGGNYVVGPTGPVAAGPYTQLPGGSHGTHVAGIAAGSGMLSEGDLTGVAPGATLYAFQMQSISQAAMSFDWILQNGASLDPPIRVVNNSWHCATAACRAHPTEQIHYKLASSLAEHGIVVTWAAGNERGDGAISTVSAEATNRTPGIISVANYKDEDTGTRQGCLSSSSSWGASADPTTWPDVAAPGRSIMSTWAATVVVVNSNFAGRNPVNGANSYREATGTSMAAPHVAGIAALLLQLNPGLTPAEVEYLLKQTATPLEGPVGPGNDACGIPYLKADPSHPWHGANYAAGHGLVDALEAARLADGFAGMPPLEEPETLPDWFVVSRPGIEPQQTLWLAGEDDLVTEYPDGPAPKARVFGPAGRLVFESEPAVEPLTFDAVEVDLFVGSSSEHGEIYSIVGEGYHAAWVHIVDAHGVAREVLYDDRGIQPVLTMAPIHREYKEFAAAPITLQEGERVRLTYEYDAAPYRGVTEVNRFAALWTESTTPSRVVLGSTVARPDPATAVGCDTRMDCAVVNAEQPMEGLWCDNATPALLQWEGPRGSMLIYNCDGVVSVCPIVDAPENEWGRCEMESVPQTPTDDRGSYCTYVMPDGSRGGRGRCEAIALTEDA